MTIMLYGVTDPKISLKKFYLLLKVYHVGTHLHFEEQFFCFDTLLFHYFYLVLAIDQILTEI